MSHDLREIEQITFGIYSPEEILAMSVCKIDNPKKSGTGSVYDPRMGTTDSSQTCMTCKQNATDCPGHFGHIELSEPIVHPLFYKRVAAFLNCFCTKCHRLLITKEQIYLSGLNRFQGETRFVNILKKIEKVDICCQPTDELDEEGEAVICGKDHPAIKFNPSDCSYSMVYEDTKSKTKTSISLSVEEIKRLFDNVSLEDVELLGFNPQLSHPRNFIIVNLPVCPPCDRPYVKADGKTCDDDITIQYTEIIKTNNNLAEYNGHTKEQESQHGSGKRKRKDFTVQDIIKVRASLRFRIATTFSNSQGKAKHTTNGRAIKCFKDRLTGKDGQIRNNVMGKRCNRSARTVAGPDPTLRLNQIGIPEEVARNLTSPEYVTQFNISRLQELVDSGKIKTILKSDGRTVIDIKRFRNGTRLMTGDIIHRDGKKIHVISNKEIVKEGDKVERNGQFLPNIKPANRKYTLQIGYIVDCPLKQGDDVLVNRQPSLHKASMLGVKARIFPTIKHNPRTFRINLAITKPLNADFDGDEINIHVAQSIEAKAELSMNSSTLLNIISPQNSKPMITIVQDSLVGAYRMTYYNNKFTKSQFFDIAMKLPRPPWSTMKTDDDMITSDEILERIQHIRRILKEKGRKTQIYDGYGLVSLALPFDFNYEKLNKKKEGEPSVKIYKGVMYEGALDKTVLGSSHNAIQQVLNKEYDPETSAYFIDCIQFIANNYLLVYGFSVGLGDCLISQEEDETGTTKQKKIRYIIEKCYIEAEGVKETTQHPNIREIRVNASLNKAKDIGLRIAKEALETDNGFLSTVNSGSKGDFFNIAQITGLLGQQNLKGQRVQLLLNHGKRSLPHYPFEGMTPEMEYESRGFIDRGFLIGLNPRQFYFHAMSGREGICDTALGTATSGYMQRRIIKLTEDMKIQQDGTVRDIPGKIYQMSYGEFGVDPTRTVKVKDSQEICDISRLINRLNMKHAAEKK
jgi:DNA-directed RNA polymerase beta' subunit